MLPPTLAAIHVELRCALDERVRERRLAKASLISKINEKPDAAPERKGLGSRLRAAASRLLTRGSKPRGVGVFAPRKPPSDPSDPGKERRERMAQDRHDWHERYGFHTPHDEGAHSTAMASLHLRLAHYHAAHGEHEAAAAHKAAHEEHANVVGGGSKKKPSNRFKAGQLSDKAFGHSAKVHDPAGAEPDARRRPTPGHAGGDPKHHGFWHPEGTAQHRQAHAELHGLMAQYHEARGEHEASEAHWQAAGAHEDGHPHAGGASHNAWSSSAYTGAHSPGQAPQPRARAPRQPRQAAIPNRGARRPAAPAAPRAQRSPNRPAEPKKIDVTSPWGKGNKSWTPIKQEA